MKVFRRGNQLEIRQFFYGDAPTETELRLAARADTIRAQLRQRDTEALTDSRRLAQIKDMMLDHLVSIDPGFRDPDDLLEKIWEVLN